MPLIRNIPPSALNQIKNKYNLSHMVLWCKSEEGQYIVSTGSNADNNIQSILIGNKIKKSLGWPDMSMPTPPKIAELVAENIRLKKEVERLNALCPNLSQEKR